MDVRAILGQIESELERPTKKSARAALLPLLRQLSAAVVPDSAIRALIRGV